MMIESFATMLLADSFWSSWEDDEFVIDLITQDERDKFCRSYAGTGCEITQGMKDAICDLEIDLQPFLPLQMTQEIVDRVNEFWKGKYSVEQLHEYCQRASHRLILRQVGHGVDATDDTDIAEMFQSLGIETPRSSCEGAYEQGENLVRKVESALSIKNGHDWREIPGTNYSYLVVVHNLGDGNALFSVKATNFHSYKSGWVTNIKSILMLVGGDADTVEWEMPFDYATAKMHTLVRTIKDDLIFREEIEKETSLDEEEFEWD